MTSSQSSDSDPRIQKYLKRLRSDEKVELNTIVEEYRKELAAANQSTIDDLMSHGRASTAKDPTKDSFPGRSSKDI
jgi:hypothetical protein